MDITRGGVIMSFRLLLVGMVAGATPADRDDLLSTHLYNASRLLSVRAALLANPPPPYANATSAVGRAATSLAAAAAVEAASHETWSVLNATLSLPGVSPHNYVSIGIYNHPCNALPDECKPYPGHQPYPKPFPPSMWCVLNTHLLALA